MMDFDMLRVCRDNSRKNEKSCLPDEYYVNLLINSEYEGRITCTNENLQELIYGYLHCKGILKKTEQVKSFKYGKEKEDEVSIYVEVEEVKPDDENLSNSACITRYVKSMDSMIFNIADIFKEAGELHKRTGATHSVLLFEKDKICFQAEDISRHNAVDKAIGYYFMHKEDFTVPVLFTSGRVPADMIEKLYKVGLKVLISKSLPTKQAVIHAQKHGILLICRAWPDSFDVYSCF